MCALTCHYWHEEPVLLLDPKTFLIALVSTYKQYLQGDLLVYNLYEGSMWINTTLTPYIWVQHFYPLQLLPVALMFNAHFP